jgi:hypothetical protein
MSVRRTQAVAPHGNQSGVKEGDEMGRVVVKRKSWMTGRERPWHILREELRDDDVFEVSIIPYGEERREERGKITKVYQDAIRTWSDGTSEVVRDNYVRILVPPHLKGHDLCPYCGTDNGLEGEWRLYGACHGCGCV